MFFVVTVIGEAGDAVGGGEVCMPLYAQMAARSAACRTGVLPPLEYEPDVSVVGVGVGLAVRLRIGLQSVCIHVAADEQSNSIQPPAIPETYAQPLNCPCALMATPTGVPPETLVGEKLIQEPTFE